MSIATQSLRRRMLRARRRSQVVTNPAQRLFARQYSGAADQEAALEPAGSHAMLAEAESPDRTVVASTGLTTAGVLMALVGAWGAGVAYFGPAIGVGPAGAAAWQSSPAHAVLNLLPGLAAVGGAAAVVSGARQGQTALRRAGALVALLAGAWFVLGTVAYPVFSAAAPNLYATTGRSAVGGLAYALAYGRGVGVVLCLLSGLALVGPAATALRTPAAEEAAVSQEPDAAGIGTAGAESGRTERARTGGPRPEAAPPRLAVVPGGDAALRRDGPGGETGWRPQFKTEIVPITRAAERGPLPVTAAAGALTSAGAALTSREASGASPGAGWLRPGEWLVATFPAVELRGHPDGGGGVAAVTNRRVVFSEGQGAVRDWAVDALIDRLDGPPANPVALPDQAELDFADPTAARDFSMAVRAAGQARSSSRSVGV